MNKITTYITLKGISVYAPRPVHLQIEYHCGLEVIFPHNKLPCELVWVHDWFISTAISIFYMRNFGSYDDKSLHYWFINVLLLLEVVCINNKKNLWVVFFFWTPTILPKITNEAAYLPGPTVTNTTIFTPLTFSKMTNNYSTYKHKAAMMDILHTKASVKTGQCMVQKIS